MCERGSAPGRGADIAACTEIVNFVKLVTPTEAEKRDREEALARTRALVNAIWPSAQLAVFGSYATDLYLPTSDIDCVVLSSGCTDVAAGLKALATASLRQGIAKGIQVSPPPGVCNESTCPAALSPILGENAEYSAVSRPRLIEHVVMPLLKSGDGSPEVDVMTSAMFRFRTSR